MAEGCGAKCAKFLLIAFNILFWLCGAALLGVGIWILVDNSLLQYVGIVYQEGDDQWFNYAAYVLIAVGAFIFVTGFAGCCGAIRESPCLLGTYIFLLCLIILIEIAAVVLAFVFKNEIEMELEERISGTLRRENYTNGMQDGEIVYSGFGTAMNLFQQQFSCCGFNGTADYMLVQDTTVFPGRRPYACCPLTDPENRPSPQAADVDSTQACFEQGCEQSLKDWLDEKALILIGLGIAIACIQIFGIIFAVCLCRNPSSDKYE